MESQRVHRGVGGAGCGLVSGYSSGSAAGPGGDASVGGGGGAAGEHPGAPLTEFGAGAGAGASSGDMGGMLLDGERSHGSSQSRGAASAATLPQAEPSSLQAGGEVAAGQRRRRRDEDGEGGPSAEDPAGGRSIALRTGAGQAGAEAAASRGTAAAAGRGFASTSSRWGHQGPQGGLRRVRRPRGSAGGRGRGHCQGPGGGGPAAPGGPARGRVAVRGRRTEGRRVLPPRLPGSTPAPLLRCTPASQGSQGWGVAPSPSSSTSSASSSTSGSAASRPSSGKHRSPCSRWAGWTAPCAPPGGPQWGTAGARGGGEGTGG